MKTYFAYTRVSTARQGEGVSLQEQRRAIQEYAARRGLEIGEWIEEHVSAAKHGRPRFSKLVSLLKARKSAGLIIHKIDRGARNLRDWADMADLMDRGVEVHFAHESIDLHTRSGRLSADILAVVAADYIRNLREETIKGINGRLRQGIYPFNAPVGYVNNGGGKPKTIDPVRGPLIRLAFELYASREYPLRRLQQALFDRGLRTPTGQALPIPSIAVILRNPFYIGLIRLRNRRETYAGVHEPLITSSLFNEVQLVLGGKRSHLRQKNSFLFRSFIRCEHCKLYLVGERQKGHIYYRCHRRACPTTCIREERFETAVLDVLKCLVISPEEEPLLSEAMKSFKTQEAELTSRLRHEAMEQLEAIERSIQTLLQKFLDNAVSKDAFDQGNGALLMQRTAADEKLVRLSTNPRLYQQVAGFLDRLRSICGAFCGGTLFQRREIIEDVFVFITTDADTIHLTLTPLMQQIAQRQRTDADWSRLLAMATRALDERHGSSIVPR